MSKCGTLHYDRQLDQNHVAIMWLDHQQSTDLNTLHLTHYLCKAGRNPPSDLQTDLLNIISFFNSILTLSYSCKFKEIFNDIHHNGSWNRDLIYSIMMKLKPRLLQRPNSIITTNNWRILQDGQVYITVIEWDHQYWGDWVKQNDRFLSPPWGSRQLYGGE